MMTAYHGAAGDVVKHAIDAYGSIVAECAVDTRFCRDPPCEVR